MINPDTKEFIENWENKLVLTNPQELHGLYDQFNTLYTIHNRCYREAFEILKAANQLTKSRYSDFEKATGIVITYLGAQSIIDSIVKNDNQKNVEIICQLLRDKTFHINLNNGQPNEELDCQLSENLQSNDVNIKSQALLSLIYNVRCNVVHGYKDFQEYQRLLIEPITELLSVIVQLFKNNFK